MREKLASRAAAPRHSFGETPRLELRIKVHALALSSLALISGCAKKRDPEPLPAPVQEAQAVTEQIKAQIEAQTGHPVENLTVTMTYVEPPDDLFVEMTIAAAGWAKSSIGARRIGVYQNDGADRRFRMAVEGVTRRFAFRPIGQSDLAVVCNPAARTPSANTSPTVVCSMKYVDAVLTFNSVRMARDSGFVGLNITRVPSGSSRSERTYYCVTLLKKDQQWEAKRSERMVDWNRCRQGTG